MTATDLGPPPGLEAGTRPRARKRRGRRFYLTFVAVVILVAAGTGTVSAVSLRYGHAAPLACACGLSWTPPDRAKAYDTRAGSHSAINVPADLNRRQAFYVEIINRSKVTQTILGLASDGPTAENPRLSVSMQDVYRSGRTDDNVTYTTKPVAIPPGGQYTLRYDFTSTDHGPGSVVSWAGLSVRVRVGWFTRTEYIDFGNTEFAVVQR